MKAALYDAQMGWMLYNAGCDLKEPVAPFAFRTC